jgi:RNA polymerase sigma-70 factor (ECF subfamily)
MMMTPENKSLIQAAQAGKQMAFRQLVEQYDKKVLGLAFKMLGNQQDAEDVYQEVFMSVFSHIQSFQFQSSFDTWLYRIVVNTSLNYRKKRNRHQRALSDTAAEEPFPRFPDERPLPDAVTISQEIREQIETALSQLTLIQRTIFVLRFYQDFKIKDIAEIVSCSEGTVKNTLFRSTLKMRRLLAKYRYE